MSDKPLKIKFGPDEVKYVEIEEYDYEPGVDKSLTSTWSTEFAKDYELSNEDWLVHEPSYRDIDTIQIRLGEKYVTIEYWGGDKLHVRRWIPNHAIVNIVCQDKIPVNIRDLSEHIQEKNK